MSNNYLDEIEFNSKKVARSKSILNELDELEDDESSLPSSLYMQVKQKHKTEKKSKNEKEDSNDDDEWALTLSSFKAPKIKKKSKSLFDGFDIDSSKKGKKKKKQKNGQAVSHKKDFEPEMALLRNLQISQNKFVDSLQKKYDQMENTKSTARGIGKYTTDLINSINGARSVSMQLIDKIISTKKTIADLDFKERKEFGSNSNSEQQNLANYASTYLKQMMDAGRNNIVNNNSYPAFDNSSEDNEDDIFSSISESLGDTGRSSEVEKYLKYENDNIVVKVIWYEDRNDDDIQNKYDFIAINKNGERVLDYPLPEKTKLNLNRATGMATDIYGNKYPLEVI